MIEKYSDTASICRNCKNAYKRGSFELKKYGNYGYPFECMLQKENNCKAPDDGCEMFSKKEQGK